MSQKNAFAALEQDTTGIESKMGYIPKKKKKKPVKYEYVPDHVEFSINIDTDEIKKNKRGFVIPNKPTVKEVPKPKTKEVTKPVEVPITVKKEIISPKIVKPVRDENEVEEKFSVCYNRIIQMSKDGFVPGHITFQVGKLTAGSTIVKKKKMTNELNQIVQWYDQYHGVVKDHTLAFEITEKLYKFTVSRDKTEEKPTK
jgi:hypothetical protein